MKAIIVFITSANRSEAAQIARLLIAEKLAACVQVLPEITSIYHWQNEILEDKEILLLAKTTPEKFARLEKAVRANHSYEVPEIVAVPIAEISEPYLTWLQKNMAE